MTKILTILTKRSDSVATYKRDYISDEIAIFENRSAVFQKIVRSCEKGPACRHGEVLTDKVETLY